MARVALYAHEESRPGDLARLDRQVRRLATQGARRPGWGPVVTFADRWPSGRTDRPGLPGSSPDAGYGAFDLVAIDGLARLTPDRATREALLSRLTTFGVQVVDLHPSAARRLAAVVADLHRRPHRRSGALNSAPDRRQRTRSTPTSAPMQRYGPQAMVACPSV